MTIMVCGRLHLCRVTSLLTDGVGQVQPFEAPQDAQVGLGPLRVEDLPGMPSPF